MGCVTCGMCDVCVCDVLGMLCIIQYTGLMLLTICVECVQ